MAYGLLTQVRGLGSYAIPKIDAQVSAVFQSKPGALLAANYAVPAATVAQSLGRRRRGTCRTSRSIWSSPERCTEIGSTSSTSASPRSSGSAARATMVSLDLYNALNASAVLTYNNSFTPGGTVAAGELDLTGRLARISAEFSW